jgi:hypothetical protein
MKKTETPHYGNDIST